MEKALKSLNCLLAIIVLFIIVSVVFDVFALHGVVGLEPPTCGSEEAINVTKNIVRNYISEIEAQAGGATIASSLVFSVNNVMTTAFDRDAGRYSCGATLQIRNPKAEGNGSYSVIDTPLEYQIFKEKGIFEEAVISVSLPEVESIVRYTQENQPSNVSFEDSSTNDNSANKVAALLQKRTKVYSNRMAEMANTEVSDLWEKDEYHGEIFMSPSDLIMAFNDNKVEANQKCKGTSIFITEGDADSQHSGIDSQGNVYVTFTCDDAASCRVDMNPSGVKVIFSKTNEYSIETLRKAQNMNVRGTCTGLNGSHVIVTEAEYLPFAG